MSEDDPAALETLIKHLYSFTYPDLVLAEQDAFIHLPFHCSVLALASKYCVDTLKAEASGVMVRMLSKNSIKGPSHNDNLQTILAALAILYDHMMSEDESLKTSILEFIYCHRKIIFSDSNNRLLVETFQSCPQLARDIANYAFTRHVAEGSKECYHCRKTADTWWQDEGGDFYCNECVTVT